MNCNEEIQQLTGYVRSVVTGVKIEADIIDQRAIKTLLRQPLYMWLLKLAQAGCKIRGTRGNTPRDVLDLIEQVRDGAGMTKQDLAARSGVSRGHVHDLLADPDPRPLVETVVRLAVGLGFPLEIVGMKEARFDDADPRSDDSTRADGSSWQQAGVFGASMFGGSVLPLLLGGRGAAYVGLGLLGAATIGLGAQHLDEPRRREMACFIGAGLVAAAALGLFRGTRGGTPHAT